MLGLFEGIIGGISSLGGLLGASAARARAEQQQQMALMQLQQQNDQLYANALDTNNRTLLQQTGLGGDAITNLGRNLSSNLSAAGVYNSGATAGAIASAQRNEQAALADLASRLQTSAWQQRQQGLMNIGQLRFGLANQGYQTANNELTGARQGLSSFLGSLAQQNLMRSGANAQRVTTPNIYGNTERNTLPGNSGGWNVAPNLGAMTAGTYGVPAQSFVSSPNYTPYSAFRNLWLGR